MNGLLERLATSCPKTWEGSGDLSGSQGDGMQRQGTLRCHHQPIRGLKSLNEPMGGQYRETVFIPLGMQTRWGS